MKPVVVETEGDLQGPVEVVWELLTDWERQTEWQREMSNIVVTSERREGVGVEARATVRIGGISTTDLVRVDVWEPPTHLGLVHEGWVRGRGDIRLGSRPDGTTQMDWREELRPPWGILGAAGLRLFAPLLRRTFRRDFEILGRLVRERSRDYPGGTV
jgi:uncharacterized membrane protein